MVASVFWVLALVIFLSIQWRLSVRGNTYIQDAAHTRTWLDRSAVRFDLELATIRFVGASLTMAALIIGAGKRVAFAVPVLLTSLLPALFGGVPDCYAFDQSKEPHALGPGWSYTAPINGCGYQFFATWGGVAIDLALVLVPLAVLAIIVKRKPDPLAPRSQRPGSVIVAGAAALIGVVFAISVRESLGFGTDWFVWLSIHIPLVAFGAMLGLRRSWWSLALIVVPLSLFPIQAGVPYSFDPWGAAYLVTIAVLAASWRPLASLIEKGRWALTRLSGRVAVPTGS